MGRWSGEGGRRGEEMVAWRAFKMSSMQSSSVLCGGCGKKKKKQKRWNTIISLGMMPSCNITAGSDFFFFFSKKLHESLRTAQLMCKLCKLLKHAIERSWPDITNAYIGFEKMFKLKVYSQFHCPKRNSSSFFSSFLNIVSLKLIQINSIKVFYLDIIILLLHNYARAYRAYHHYHSITQNYHTLTLIRAHNDIRENKTHGQDGSFKKCWQCWESLIKPNQTHVTWLRTHYSTTTQYI